MKNVVVDTNVFISAFIGSKICRNIYELLKKDRFRLVVTDDLLSEIETVLVRTKFELTKEEIEEATWHIRKKALKIIPSQKVTLCRDPKDNFILECATVVKVDFIVTGDKDLLTLKSFRKIPIITPHQFLKILS